MPDAAGVCTANTQSCGAGDALFMCDSEGTQLTKVQDCQYGCATDHCKACMADTTFCSGDDLVMCTSGGELSNPMTCQFGCQGMACNACMPSTTYCSGQNAVTCTAAGQPGTMMNCGTAGCNGGVCNTCQPNTTSCNGDTLVVCNGGGTIQSATPCALGCSTTGTTHCNALVPLFGVPAPSGTLPDLTLADNATLDISNCAALDVKLTIGSTTTAIPSTQLASVSQASMGGPPICVVKYGAISIPDTFSMSITNSSATGHVLSLEATGDIDIGGKIFFTNLGNGSAPGGNTFVVGTNANNKYMAAGGGGAGGARAGGTGGACIACSGGSTVAGGGGGVALTGDVLRGGSGGGDVMNGTTVVAGGGLGGGAIHLVSLTKVTLAASAQIGLNGTGGGGPFIGSGTATAGGGGSGGMLVVEAPKINISAGAIAAANGGGGSASGIHTIDFGGGIVKFFHNSGQPGQLSATRAAGGDNPNTTAGDGGYEADGTANPSSNGAASDSGAANYGGGGGGGAKGFIVLRGRAAANVMIAFGAVISPMPAIDAVNKQ